MFSLRKKLSLVRVNSSQYSKVEKAIYKFLILYRGFSFSEVVSKVVIVQNTDEIGRSDRSIFYIVDSKECSPTFKVNKFGTDTNWIRLEDEPLALIDDYLIQKGSDTNDSFYFSVYTATKGSLEYGPFVSYNEAMLTITKIKAIVNMKEDEEIRFYSDPYSKRYGYTDKLVQQALESE